MSGTLPPSLVSHAKDFHTNLAQLRTPLRSGRLFKASQDAPLPGHSSYVQQGKRRAEDEPRKAMPRPNASATPPSITDALHFRNSRQVQMLRRESYLSEEEFWPQFQSPDLTSELANEERFSFTR
jgi:hypothetical protein